MFVNNEFAEYCKSHSHLKRRTPEGGIPRPDYIEHLVEEYHTTTNVGKKAINQSYKNKKVGAIKFLIPTEAKEQVTANLANFAYDPINWEYLCGADALDVFEDCIKSPNERLQQHALAGFCNMCLDTTSFKFITKSEVFASINLLMQTTETTDIYLNCIALFYQLLTADICTQKEKSLIVTPPVLKTITKLKNLSPDPRVKNLATLFCEDFGSRIEEKEDFKNVLSGFKAPQQSNNNEI